MKQVFNVLIGVFVGFLLAGLVFLISRVPGGKPIELQPAPTLAPIAVDVTGAVVRPGLYEFTEGSRVQDAIDAAGGLLAAANTDALNLAARLEDGQQLAIPYKEGAEPTQEPLFSSSSPFPTATASGSESTGDLVNINTASVEELDALPGIGSITAQKIIAYRELNGPFVRIEDIVNVPGIGPATYDELKSLITVGD